MTLNRKSIEKVKEFGGSVKMPGSPTRRPPEVAQRIEQNIVQAAAERESERKERLNKRILWFQWGSFDSYEFRPQEGRWFSMHHCAP